MDASGKGLGIVMWPDRLAFHINACPLGCNRTSIDAELEALISAVCLLQYEQNVETIFHTDCDAVLKGVLRGCTVGARPNSRRFHMLQFLRRFFRKEGCWKLEWVLGHRNRIADRLSRQRICEYAQSIEIGERKFHQMNTGKCECRIPNANPLVSKKKPAKPKTRTANQCIADWVTKQSPTPPQVKILPLTNTEGLTPREYLRSSLGLGPFLKHARA